MNRHDMDWEQLGMVWRATAIDKEALVAQLRSRLQRQMLFRRLEIAAEIFFTILAVFAGIFLWKNMEGADRWRQIALVASLFALVAGSWAVSVWMRRGTGGEAQTLTAMIDLAIARAESRRRRVFGIALGGVIGILWGVAFWFLFSDPDDGPHSITGLAFILSWCCVWAVALTGWEYVKLQREKKYLTQFREIKQLLQEEP
jgi:hypothetical protein